jgi:hypothetical protein
VVSRRRLFGLLGGAAAAGASLAVAGSALDAAPAAAGSGTMMYGATNNAGSSETELDANVGSGKPTLQVTNTSTGFLAGDGLDVQSADGSAIFGFSTNNVGVAGHSNSNYGGAFFGVRAPLFLSNSALAGAPTLGTHQIGEFYVDLNGVLFYCIKDGSPGMWANLSTGRNLVTVDPPARVYDSRVGFLPSTGPKQPTTNGATVSVDVTGPKAGGGSSGVPSGAAATLGNITVVSRPEQSVFLTVFPAGGSVPSTSTVNAQLGLTVANSFTTQVGTSNQISVACTGGPADVIVDILGYYP